MQSQKQRLKRKAKKSELDQKKLVRKNTINQKIKQAKSHYQHIKEQRRAEVKVLSYIFKSINGRMPEEGESLDNVEIKALCKKFLKEKPVVAYYDEIAIFAEKKIKQIEFAEDQEKKLKKLTKKK
jgi:hypothetical protein